MKARKVRIVLEVLTALPIKALKDVEWWRMGMVTDAEDPGLGVARVEVTVIKPSK